MQSQAWMTSFLFNKLSSFSKRQNASGIFNLINIPSYKHTWFTWYVRSSRINAKFWVWCDHITSSHNPCPTTFKCELFKAIQNCFQNKKTNAMVRNKHCELNKSIMIGQVSKSLDQSLSQKKSKVSSKLQELSLSIPKSWTKRPKHFMYTQQWLQTFQMKMMMILME